MYFLLSGEVPAPDIKWGGEDVGSNSSNLPIQTKTFKSPHTFAGLRNASYSSYRHANKIEIPFLKLSMLAASQSSGAAVPYLKDDLAGTPLHDVLSVLVLSLLLGAGQGKALHRTAAWGLTWWARTHAWHQRRGKVAPAHTGRRECKGDQPLLCCCHLSWAERSGPTALRASVHQRPTPQTQL